MNNTIRFALSILITLAAGAVGSLATSANIDSWYTTLNKPAFTPPNELFGLVWFILYVLMGMSLYLVWIQRHKVSKRFAFWAFAVQLVLSTLWTFVFFGLHAPAAAIGVIAILLLGISVTIASFWNISKTAAYLLVPYILWVGFAVALNIGVAVLN